jgi:hypothetical protein
MASGRAIQIELDDHSRELRRILRHEPLRIRRNTFSIVTDYTFARSASHKTRRRFKSSIYLLADHAFGFAPGAVATPHQFHHPQRYNAVCLGCQHYQRSEHPRTTPAWFVPVGVACR